MKNILSTPSRVWCIPCHTCEGPDPSTSPLGTGKHPTACELIQHIYICLVILAGNILILIKTIKILITPQSIFLVAIIIMVITQIITILIHLMWHGHH